MIGLADVPGAKSLCGAIFKLSTRSFYQDKLGTTHRISCQIEAFRAGYITSMVFLRLYPQMLQRGGWALPMRVMQGAVVVGGILNWKIWQLEATDPTTSPIA
jgi:hypothetical protein